MRPGWLSREMPVGCYGRAAAQALHLVSWGGDRDTSPDRNYFTISRRNPAKRRNCENIISFAHTAGNTQQVTGNT